MDDAVFEGKLNELVNEIGALPGPQKDRLIGLAKQTNDCHKKLKNGIGRLQESLDYLRVSVKYLIFDLEATQRENADLKKLLKDKNNG